MKKASVLVKAATDNAVPILASLAAILLVAVLRRKKSRSGEEQKNLPPGPKGYPILGTFPAFLGKPAHLVFDGWTKMYGNIYKFNIGSNTAVVLGDAETVRSAMLKKDSSMDSRCQWRECFIKTFRGLSVLPYARKWINTRARTMKILKDMGMGKSAMEGQMTEEIHNLLETLAESSRNGEVAIDPRDIVRRSPMNIICLLVFGENYGYKSSKSIYAMNLVVKLVNILAKASVFDILPKQLRQVAGFSLFEFHDTLGKVSRYIEEEVELAKRNSRTKKFRYFVDEWMQAVDSEKKRLENSSMSGTVREFSKLTDVLQDVMIAGAHSTGIILNWIVLFLTMYPEEQEKLYEEIKEKIGLDNWASNADRAHMVRVDAFIHEAHRVATILPLVAHATCLDTDINGYNIPSNIEVIYNNWTINHDEETFPEPFAFKPDRWINEEGKMRTELQDKFFPYGIGKRSCAGMALAKMQLFMTTTALVQRLRLLPPGEDTPESLQPGIEHQVGLLAETKAFCIRVKRREESL